VGNLVVCRKPAALFCQQQCKQGQGCQLRSEGLGRCNADFRAGASQEFQGRFAHQRRLGHIADGQCDSQAQIARMFDGSQCVGSLAGLRDGHHQRIGLRRRSTIAILAGKFDTAGNAGQLFDPVAGHQSGVVAGTAGQDQHRTRPLQQFGGRGAKEIG
jgi:hypothetical protein